MAKIQFTIAALVLATLAAPQAFGWADLGHSIVGAVAEENIKPSTRDYVRGVLGIEPLGAAAIWADHVKDDDRFAHRDDATTSGAANTHWFSDYHFCEIPVGYTYATRPQKALKDCHGAILGAIALLKDVKGQHSRAEKMIALRYLVHIMGDITQPLHVGNGYDQGGNGCQVRWQASATATPVNMNLHAFWDDTMVGYLGATYADPAKGRRAALYYSQYLPVMKERRPEMFGDLAKAKYGAGVLDDWLMEATVIRESGLYPDDASVMANVPKGEEYKNRPYCLWYDPATGKPANKVDSTKIPTLTADDYGNRFATTVETQLLVGGLRLAKTLDDIADSAMASAGQPVKVVTDAMQESILANVQKAFLVNPDVTPATKFAIPALLAR